MNNKPIFTLDHRLALCASMVRKNSKVVDIGTDHAYLPIWLVKNNITSDAIAADLRKGPLENANANILKYGVTGNVNTILSDGLKEISSQMVDDVIIAGMGGDVISDIIKNAPWLKDSQKHLILQPMTCAEKLRRFLQKEGFKLIKEQAVESDVHIYSVMLAEYSNSNLKYDNLYPYIGLLQKNIDSYSIKYIKKEIIHLENKLRGLIISGNEIGAQELSDILQTLKDIINNK